MKSQHVTAGETFALRVAEQNKAQAESYVKEADKLEGSGQIEKATHFREAASEYYREADKWERKAHTEE